MPILTISGLPADLSPMQMSSLKERLATAVSIVDELRLSPKHVTVRLPVDLDRRQSRDLDCSIGFLFAKPERTYGVIKCLVDNIGAVLRQFARELKLQYHIEVYPYMFDPETQPCYVANAEVDDEP